MGLQILSFSEMILTANGVFEFWDIAEQFQQYVGCNTP